MKIKKIKVTSCTEYIRLAAYFKALKRGFTSNHQLDDWLEAERECKFAFVLTPIKKKAKGV